MLPEYIIIHGSESPLGQKCHDLVKDYNFPFKKITLLAVLRDLKVKLKFQDNFYNIIHHNKCPSSEKSADNVF